MTGQLKSTPVEALRLKSSIPSYETPSDATSNERAKRLPEDHPSNIASFHQGTCAKAGPEKARNSKPPLLQRRQTESPSQLLEPRPWNRALNPTFSPFSRVFLTNLMIKTSFVPQQKQRISEWNYDLSIYTDGSAVAGYSQGGAGVVVHIHDDSPRYETLRSK